MENLYGYIHGHPELDALSSEWYIFTFKGKFYQISVSIDSFHDEKEYDLRVYLFDKRDKNDNYRLSKVIETLQDKSQEIDEISVKIKLQDIIGVLYAVIIQKKSIKGVTFSNDLIKLVNKKFNNISVKEFIDELYNNYK